MPPIVTYCKTCLQPSTLERTVPQNLIGMSGGLHSFQFLDKIQKNQYSHHLQAFIDPLVAKWALWRTLPLLTPLSLLSGRKDKSKAATVRNFCGQLQKVMENSSGQTMQASRVEQVNLNHFFITTVSLNAERILWEAIVPMFLGQSTPKVLETVLQELILHKIGRSLHRLLHTHKRKT